MSPLPGKVGTGRACINHAIPVRVTKATHKQREQKMGTQAVWAKEEPLEKQDASFAVNADLADMALDSNEIPSDGLAGIVGNSCALRRTMSMVRMVAPTGATVLINGETGTGKELIAEAIHKTSDRAHAAFVKVNCAAIPPALLESELFGHERGAFTGAAGRRTGRFEMANRGTIFLDEIGELPLELQPKLLRVLQERELERVGGTQSVRINVRVIAATNRNLKEAVDDRSFRPDLFYRLNVFPIDVPPLRERRSDILLLLEHFTKRFAGEMGKKIRTVDRRTLELFQAHDWPGNIRELQNVVERAVILTSGAVLSVDEAWFSKEPVRPAPAALHFAGHEKSEERRIIEGALAESRGRIAGPSGAAAKLRIPRSTLESKIKALDISKCQFKFATAG
jgi:transcriptional regulator with GAF, ATPase, and Fis domain